MSKPHYQPRSPDFIGIGAQKAGTSWLDFHLRRHPGVWMPPIKELHYFDRSIPWAQFPPASVAARLGDSEWRLRATGKLHALASSGASTDLAWWTRYHLGDHDDAWYRSLFADAPVSQLVGEITPQYAICDTAAIAHMHAVAPNAKILMQLRDPVDRFWSQCQMNQHRQILTHDLGDILRFFDSPRGQPRGDYAATLLNFCEFYDPSAVLLVFYDAIVHTPARLLADVAAFLELPAHPATAHELALRVNPAPSDTPVPDAVRDAVAAAYANRARTLGRALGGYAQAWYDGKPPIACVEPGRPSCLATLRLTASHLDVLREANARHAAGATA